MKSLCCQPLHQRSIASKPLYIGSESQHSPMNISKNKKHEKQKMRHLVLRPCMSKYRVCLLTVCDAPRRRRFFLVEGKSCGEVHMHLRVN